jgi:hypothetical protein
MGYYSGDPGFFSIVKSLAGSALGLVPGGGVVRSGLRAIGGTLATRGSTIASKAGSAIIKHPVLSAAGAAGTIALGTASIARHGMVPAGMHGMHISRKTGRMVRNRHMRVTNPKALRRALRRAHGFAKLAMKTIHLIHPRKKVKFGGFRKHKKK